MRVEVQYFSYTTCIYVVCYAVCIQESRRVIRKGLDTMRYETIRHTAVLRNDTVEYNTTTTLSRC